MRLEYYLDMRNRPSAPLEEKFDEQLLSVSGTPLKVKGVVSVPVRISSTVLEPDVRFFVVDELPPASSVILGLEFILEHLHAVYWTNLTFSLKAAPRVVHKMTQTFLPYNPQNRIATGDGRAREWSPRPAANGLISTPVMLVRTIVLRPHSSWLVNCTVSTNHALHPAGGAQDADKVERLHLFEPELPAELGDDVASTPTLVSPTYDAFPVLLHNRSGRYVSLRARTVVGQLTHVTLGVQPDVPSPAATMRVHSSRIGQITMTPSSSGQPDGPDVLRLSRDIAIDLSGTIPLTTAQREKLKTMLIRNIAAFAGNPKRTSTTTLAQHHIDTGTHPPVYVPPYRTSPAQRQVIVEQAQDMLENGVIRPSNSPYSSPVLLVKKSDGKDRFCVDFRKLNLNTKKDVYPLPRVDDMLDALGKADYFSVLDLQTGFWQIPLNPEDMEKTAFSTDRGHYEFVVMPFGLCNAPATFQRAMDQLLRDLREFCQAYMDDVITFTEGDYDTHILQLETMLQRLQSAPMVAKPAKFKPLQRELKFLGHIISRHTIKPDPAKTSAVHAFPTPKRVKDLQSFMGLVGYYRRFIPHMATTAASLYRLFQKDVPWQWGAQEDQAMLQLKQALTSAPVMRLPNFDRPFVLYTDASNTGLGAVLAQLDESHSKRDHPVYYASRTLNSAERHYSATKRECLAVKWACAQFRPYLLGRPFTVYTDHAALAWLMRAKDSESILIRWVLQLQEFDMKIIARPGTEHANADALSRLPALLEAREPKTHHVISVVTRTTTHSLPARRRGREGLDSELVLDDRAYDMDEAIRLSQKDNATDADITMADDEDNDVDPDGRDADVLDDVPPVHDHLTPPPSVDPTVPDLAAEQRRDSQLSPIITYLADRNTTDPSVTDAVRADSKDYVLAHDMLYYQWDHSKVKPRLSTQQYRAVIPKALRVELLHQLHDGVCGAHLGESKTYERIADQYYWPNMYADIKKYVQTCAKCGARKQPSLQHSQAPLHSIPRPSQPFETLGIDVLGPLPKTRLRHQFIVVITDYFTRWPIALAMKNQKAHTIATLLVEQVFCQHGFPATLLSDRGANFLSELMAAVLHVFHVKKLNTTSYHPQTNGLTERFNHTLCAMLSHYTSQNQTDWDVYLPYVLLAYRTTPHHTLRETPFYMLYGRNLRYPFDTIATPLHDVELKDNAAEYVDSLVDKLKTADELVRARLLAKDDRRLAANHALSGVVTYAVGDKVWLHNPVVKQGLTRKLTSPWVGPFEVIDTYPNLVNYKVHPLDKLGRRVNNAKSRLVHVGRLKRYFSPDTSEIRLSDVSKP